ncbi:Ubiquitin carboxyl-terminal hydrolase 1 [Tolypocladium ophioglossoides CBS 100239]|uniref:ubiquitinyl hydrolase 1 n=1 Tax=Tolypocladium ophioglossoides (strain CBS 100239) TaxID=1163406 RepID=A0A0L0NI10_TOLOC|nr:Ubiquitin carboxyl-terminal hydrolase 1 [Tolypocladium ophioglossoides CBS 100239]
MNPQQSKFGNFYEDRIAAHRQPHLRDHILERWNEPSVILSALALLVTIIFKIHGSEGALESAACSLGAFLWDCLVFIIPAPLLFAMDGWMNSPSTPRPMLDAQPRTHGTKRDAMRRILGLDRSGGLMSSVFRARSRALSMTGSVLGLKPDCQRPPGLGNRDNSCYQNCILQGLAALESFTDYLSACVRTVDAQNLDQDVARTLRTLIWDLNDVSNNGKTIWTPSLLKSMSTWTQQDAQEYYSKMLDDIDKGVAKAIKETRRYSGLEADCGKDESAASQHSDDSGYQSLSSTPDLSAMKPLRNPLEGLLAQRVACVQCGYSEGLSMIPFNCLTLSLGLDKNRHDLYERLDSYSNVETIEGVECPKCTLLKAQRLLTKLVGKMQDCGSSPEQLAEPRRRLGAVETALEDDDFSDKTLMETCRISSRGKVSSTKTKQIVIARPPQSLAIHVNRSVFDPATFDMIKNSAPVSFPLTLDLGPWCLGSSEATRRSSGAAKPSGEGDASEEKWQSDPRASMIAGDLSPSRLNGPIYELRAAVTHAGRHENGHYVCYRKYPEHRAAAPDAAANGQESSNSATDDGIDDEEATGSDTDETKPPDVATGGNTGWWRLSDQNVNKIDEETVLSLSPGVFMLFYECVDPSMVSQSGAETMEDANAPASPNELEGESAGAKDSSVVEANSTEPPLSGAGCDVTSADAASEGPGR